MNSPNHLDLLEEAEAIKCRSLLEAWPTMSAREHSEKARSLERHVLEDLFLHLATDHKAELLSHLKAYQRWSLVHLLAPDDIADVIQAVSPALQSEILAAL
ncbi:MAG: magnesium transporter MgtE N-terminal domain-containing protein, partial [Bdellovibrionales bacterium]